MKTPQEKIQEILDKCSTENYIFRGEKQKHDKVSSALYRQYCEPDNNSDGNTHPPINSKYFSIFTVEKDIVEKAKQHFRPDVPNIEILTELQHYGGKTTLLDFSKDLHIALFFACDGDFDEDGRVILFKTSELPEHKGIFYKNLSENSSENICTLISPTGKSPRVIFQSSIFIHASKGYLKDDTYKIITIEKNLKKPLLEYLRQHFNIRTETIYNDIQGFVRNQHNYATAEIEFYRGYTSFQENNLEDAVEYYRKAIELNPQFSKAYNNRGAAHHALEQHQKAINDCNKAIELNPQDANAYYNRGTAYRALKQYQDAINDYNEVIKLDPQSADAYNNRGNLYCALKQYQEAINNYNKAIGLNPQSANAYNNRGTAHHALEQYQEAINDHNKVIELDPQSANAYTYNNRGTAHHALKQHQEAVNDYDEAIKLNPQHAEAYYNRGLAYLCLEQYQEALTDFSSAKTRFKKEGNIVMVEECEMVITELNKLIPQ